MTLPIIHANREAWQHACVDELRSFFSSRGYTLPAEIRVACGYPTNAKRSGFKVLGECIPNTNSADGHWEIYISPILSDPSKVTETLIAQLCRTAKGAYAVTNVAYAKVAEAMLIYPDGTLSNPYKTVVHGSAFDMAYQDIIDSLGVYPHAKVDVSIHKSQGTRMLLAKCPTCQCSIRMTAKWVYNAHGDVELPTCRCGDMFALA
jgi:hypothetical protein